MVKNRFIRICCSAAMLLLGTVHGAAAGHSSADVQVQCPAQGFSITIKSGWLRDTSSSCSTGLLYATKGLTGIVVVDEGRNSKTTSFSHAKADYMRFLSLEKLKHPIQWGMVTISGGLKFLTATATVITDGGGEVYTFSAIAALDAAHYVEFGGTASLISVNTSTGKLHREVSGPANSAAVGAMFTTLHFTAVALQGLPLAVWISPDRMGHNANPTLFAKTRPEALCTATVVEVDGRQPKNFLQRYAESVMLVGESGIVSWPWHEQTTASGGVATVTCSYDGLKKTASASFQVD